MERFVPLHLNIYAMYNNLQFFAICLQYFKPI